MIGLRRINLGLRRHRRATVLLGTIIVLGVAALNTHAAVPDHHDAGDAICLCAFSIATLGALAWGAGRSLLGTGSPLRWLPFVPAPGRLVVERPLHGIARAGPAGSVVLRR